MPSTLTAYIPIPENSAGTPGLWDSRFTALQQNILQVQGGVAGTSSNTLTAESGNTILVASSVFSIPNSLYAPTIVGSPTWNVNITGTAPANSLTGTILAGNVVTSSLTTIGTLVAGAVPASLVTAGTFGAGSYGITVGLTIGTVTAIDIPSSTLTHQSGAFDHIGAPFRITRGPVAALSLRSFGTGTAATPATTTADQTMGSLFFQGWDGSASTYQDGPVVTGRAAATWSATSHPSQLDFVVIPRNSITSHTFMRFGANAGDNNVSANLYGLTGQTLSYMQYTAAAYGQFSFSRVNNTIASPTALAANDLIGFIGAYGSDGTNHTLEGAEIGMQATGDWSVGATPTQIVFDNTLTGTTGQVATWVMGADATFGPIAARTNLQDIGRSTATIRSYYVGTSILPGANDTAVIGSSSLGFKHLWIRHAVNAPTGLLLESSAASNTPRIQFYNATAYGAGTGSSIYMTAANQVSFTTGSTINSTTGTTRWYYNATDLSPETDATGIDLGAAGQRWKAIYGLTVVASTRVTSPLLGTTTAVDVVFDRNSVTQLTLGSLLATFAGDITVASGKVYKVNGTQVVGAQITGYTAMTGTPDKATAYDTATVTLAQLAGRVAQLQADLTTHGLIHA